ncbi:MAG: hypothetical protein KTR33_02440 [Gammaproteobacteria bacterium]|nr:hypothetical protein [Gammaproteobacteria bacterium]
MTLESFLACVEQQNMPDGLSLELQSLWADATGDWHRAHDLCQQEGTRSGDRIHAYLHRKEGDSGNASYWYYRSGEPMPTGSLEEEWTELVQRFLEG